MTNTTQEGGNIRLHLCFFWLYDMHIYDVYLLNVPNFGFSTRNKKKKLKEEIDLLTIRFDFSPSSVSSYTFKIRCFCLFFILFFIRTVLMMTKKKRFDNNRHIIIFLLVAWNLPLICSLFLSLSQSADHFFFER